MDILLQLRELAGHPRPGAHRRRHEHPRLLHRPPVDGGRQDEGRRLRLAQPPVDFIFFPQHQGVRLERGWDGTMVSDHHWIAARIAMNGAGPERAHHRPRPPATAW